MALADEFNGIIRPRVAFFQEDIAAARAPGASAVANYATPSSTPAAYTFTPNATQLPTFAYWANLLDPTNAAIYNNAIVYQANTPWSSPFSDNNGDKLNKTLNGTPNDGMEAAFNAYLNEYLEIYPGDIDEAQPFPTGFATLDAALWQPELKSWHDYYKDQRALSPRSTEAPAGLSVTYLDNTTRFAVSWYAMYGANAYSLQRKTIGTTPAQDWTSVSGCDPASTSCTVTVPMGTTQYAFRVQGQNTISGNQSGWANAAIFLSESGNDGYVIKSGSSFSAVPSGPQPGIKAGEGTGTPLPHWRGILSFNTGALSSVATSIVGARLRLHQSTSGVNFSPTNPCMVDVDKGSFGGSATLVGTDYNASDCIRRPLPSTS
ncbi:MAG: fibronectin type III domain-containing protein [Chthoniobacterales bacterium]|nr:fibronectin type III domain-containing protein [Chthoniobacterales bacterium]